MRTEAEIAAARRRSILAHAGLWAKGVCHYCATPLPKGALWCRTDCATRYHAEKAELLGAK